MSIGTVEDQKIPSNEPNDSKSSWNVESKRPAIIQFDGTKNTWQRKCNDSSDLCSCKLKIIILLVDSYRLGAGFLLVHLPEWMTQLLSFPNSVPI